MASIAVQVERDMPFDPHALLAMIQWMGTQNGFSDELWRKLQDMAAPCAYPVICYESDDVMDFTSPEYKGFWIEGRNLDPVIILLIDGIWTIC